MGLMMSGERLSLEPSPENAAANLEMEELAIDTEKLNLNLNVRFGPFYFCSFSIDHSEKSYFISNL